jgi:hypothetical protein
LSYVKGKTAGSIDIGNSAEDKIDHGPRAGLLDDGVHTKGPETGPFVLLRMFYFL